MPDRDLTETEIRKFVQEHITADVFHALEAFAKESTKPTLHDLCILELSAVAEGRKMILIEQGRKIKNLKEEVLGIKARLYKLENK